MLIILLITSGQIGRVDEVYTKRPMITQIFSDREYIVALFEINIDGMDMKCLHKIIKAICHMPLKLRDSCNVIRMACT